MKNRGEFMEDIIIKSIGEALEKGEGVALVTLTKVQGSAPRKAGTMMVVYKNKTIIGTIGGGNIEHKVIEKATQCIESGENYYFDYNLNEEAELGMSCGGCAEGFIKVMIPSPKLLICGGGHIGYNLFKMAESLSFKRILLDDREGYLIPDNKKNIIVGNYAKEVKKINIDENTYVVIATKGHVSDLEVLREVISSNAAYIGLIGSRRKLARIKESLIEEGIDESIFEKLYAPIGLDISDGTPEEIALSILSEILAVKNKGNLKHLSR